MIDAELVPLLGSMPEFAFSVELLASVRAMTAARPDVTLSDDVECCDHEVRSDPRLLVRVYRPRAKQQQPLPCVYGIHGGGYILGDYKLEDERFDRWCRQFPCVGVSVEYRLAPDARYPAPLDDCFAGLHWIFEHSDELGIDPARIGVYGGSAGGGLAAGLALLARDRGAHKLAFQLLECPMIDDRQITASSQLDDLAVWNRGSNEFGWRSYLGDLYGRADVPTYAAPARGVDLSNLPSTFVIVGGADGFRDENIEYATRLAQAGVRTELHVLPGAPHGVAHLFPDTALGTKWNRLVDEWLANELRRT